MTTEPVACADDVLHMISALQMGRYVINILHNKMVVVEIYK